MGSRPTSRASSAPRERPSALTASPSLTPPSPIPLHAGNTSSVSSPPPPKSSDVLTDSFLIMLTTNVSTLRTVLMIVNVGIHAPRTVNVLTVVTPTAPAPRQAGRAQPCIYFH